mmetsp:Transcript_12080/g.25179  ORF Transcript_12080/g.25179 Transcript_12080/m.25179 type:complete len:211 (-) Transcript_12080:488-1120(-)
MLDKVLSISRRFEKFLELPIMHSASMKHTLMLKIRRGALFFALRNPPPLSEGQFLLFHHHVLPRPHVALVARAAQKERRYERPPREVVQIAQGSPRSVPARHVRHAERVQNEQRNAQGHLQDKGRAGRSDLQSHDHEGRHGPERPDGDGERRAVAVLLGPLRFVDVALGVVDVGGRSHDDERGGEEGGPECEAGGSVPHLPRDVQVVDAP